MIDLPFLAYVAVFVGYAFIGIVLGMFSGFLCTLATKLRRRLRTDAALGALGFLGGFFIVAVMPWHRNTIAYQLSGGTQVTSTMNTYQHPERIALLLAVLMPVFFEAHRFIRSR